MPARYACARAPLLNELTWCVQTSIANALAGSDFQKDMIPTVGFNLRKFTHGAVTIKIWGELVERRARDIIRC